jgi:uncharacterized protein (DUF2141 family)
MKLILSIIATAVLFVNQSISAQTKTITATVINATSDEGKVGFALYNKTTFMKKPIATKEAKIKDGESTVTFENLESGEYAVICFHDKNSNGRMDFDSNGIPQEDFGASNNVMKFAPPTYEDSKFLLTDKNVTLEIKF